MISAPLGSLISNQGMLGHQSPNSTFGNPNSTAPALGYYTISNSTTSSTTISTFTTGGGGGTSSLYLTNPTTYQNLVKQLGIAPGTECIISLPDGTKVIVEKTGKFKIEDKDAKITYKANRIREFNTFLNASDHVEGFIKYCSQFGIKRDDMLNLPIKLFIGWLVLEAAKADQEPEPDIPLISSLSKIATPRCHGCGRFISLEFVRKKIEFCRPLCFERHYDKTLMLPQIRPKLLLEHHPANGG